MRKDKIADFIGWFLVIFGIFSIVVHFTIGQPIHLLWYCNHMHILAGILILLRKRYWLTAVLSLGLIPVFLWIVDYISHIVFRYNLLGIVDYLYQETNPLLITLIHQHLFVLPLAVIALWLIGGAVKDAWKGSLLYAGILFVISFPFDLKWKLNCVRVSCISFLPNTLPFILLQYVLIFAAIVVSNWILIKITKK